MQRQGRADGLPVRLRGEHARPPGPEHAPAELRAAAQGRQHRLQLEADRAARRHRRTGGRTTSTTCRCSTPTSRRGARRSATSSRGTSGWPRAPRSTSSRSAGGGRPTCSCEALRAVGPDVTRAGCWPRSTRSQRDGRRRASAALVNPKTGATQGCFIIAAVKGRQVGARAPGLGLRLRPRRAFVRLTPGRPRWRSGRTGSRSTQLGAACTSRSPRSRRRCARSCAPTSPG